MPRLPMQQLYSAAIQKHGLTPQGVCWSSYASQQIRFATLAKHLPKDMHNYTLNDLGCGFGDLYLFLKKIDKLPKAYCGIDIHPKMCRIAKERTGASVLKQDLIFLQPPQADFSLCSGALNILKPFEVELFLHNAYASSSKALVFNALFGKKESQNFHYMSLTQIYNTAKQLGVRELTLTKGYLKNDITVGFYR